MTKRYLVTLTAEEREELTRVTSVGKAEARKFTQARILLLANEAEGSPAKSDAEIVDALGCGRATVERVRKPFVEQGLEAVLTRKPTIRTCENRRDGRAEAYLVALACGAPPEDRARWTLRLLADRMVGLGYVESVSHETVRLTLTKRLEALAEERAAACRKDRTVHSSRRWKTCSTFYHRRLGEGSQFSKIDHRLAIYDRRCTHVACM